MYYQKLKKEGLNRKNISLTAYRVLLVLGALLKRPCTKEYLTEILSKGINEEGYSKDTLRRTLNTLKKAGCVISRPTEKNGFMYSLISHPFLIDFDETQLECLNSLRYYFVLSEDYQKVYEINKLIDKLALFSQRKESFEICRIQNPFATINPLILDKFIGGELFRKVIEFDYFSANSGLESLRFIPERLSMKNSKLYLWGYCFKYNQYAFLNVERIKGINSVYEIDKDLKLPAYEVIYTLCGAECRTFTPEQNEKIIERRKTEIVVQHTTVDEFSLFQRLLHFGSDLKSVSPDYFRERFLEKLFEIRGRYFE